MVGMYVWCLPGTKFSVSATASSSNSTYSVKCDKLWVTAPRTYSSGAGCVKHSLFRRFENRIARGRYRGRQLIYLGLFFVFDILSIQKNAVLVRHSCVWIFPQNSKYDIRTQYL